MTTQQPFATDEDVAIRVPADYVLIVPEDQMLAQGDDAFLAPDDPWVLETGLADLGSRGIGRGNVVLVTYRADDPGGPDDTFAVESVELTRLRLRRKGQAAGTGAPPAAQFTGRRLRYSIPTLAPQLALLSDELDARFNIAELRRSGDLSATVVATVAGGATVLGVVYRQFLDASRRAADKADDLGAKALLYKAEFEALLEATFHRWNNRNAAASSAAVSRATRLSR